MFTHYLSVALRRLRREAGYTSLNVVGLAIGVGCCLLIGLYVQEQLSYDRFHEKGDRIYRLNKVVTPRTGGTERHVITSAPMGPSLVREYAEVEAAVRVLPWFGEVFAMQGSTGAGMADFVFADSNFFAVFDFELVRGDPETVLLAPLSAVLTESAADRLFPGQDPVGLSFAGLNGLEYHVTGIARDTPAASHLRFDVLASFSSLEPGRGGHEFGWIARWSPQALFTYLVLSENAGAASLEPKLAGWMERNFPDRADQYFPFLQPLEDIYLGSADLLWTGRTRTGSKRHVQIFGLIAILILGIACINFVNLATARATRRAHEVGVRKSVGAARRQLVRQFLAETMLLAGIAVAIGVLFMEAALPSFAAFTGITLAKGVWTNTALLVGVAVIWAITGIGSGIYPATVLSAFSTGGVLRGKGGSARFGARSRRVLVAGQFAVSVVLIVGTLVVYRQTVFLAEKDLGFEKEQVLVVETGATEVSSSFDAFAETLLGHPNIHSVAGSNSVPGMSMMSFGINPEGFAQDESWVSSAIRLDDFDLIDTYDMELVAGRYFSADRPSDQTSAVVINEALVRRLGWGVQEAVGRRLDIPGEVEEGTVIGVMEDFHFESLRREIEPLVLYYAPRYQMLSVRVGVGDLSGTLDFIASTWTAFEPTRPLEYRFVDQIFDEFYQRDNRMMATLGLFAILAILVACLGLFGLSAYSAEQRTKEIGIRKVLGASAAGIVGLLSREIAWLVLIGSAIATPVSWWVMDRWLSGFAFHVAIAPWMFVAAGGAGLTLALLTVGYQAMRAAHADPVRSLKYE